ncbi:MAG: mechanosensitive ion channel family protein [Clostridia bacterium]|nr:mechanosensitive ion channel family protein [Clostridia bacterium]
MEEIKKFFEEALKTNIISSVIVVAISIVLYKVIIYFISKGEEKNQSKLTKNNKRKTYIHLFKNILRYVFGIVTVLVVLQINGVDVSSVLTGVGIAGVIFGLAIQDWLKDVIRGSSILSDNYFQVGDVVKYKNIEGKVLDLGLKTTKIQDLSTRNIISIANRNIEEIEVVSKVIYVRIPMPYEVKVHEAEKAVNDIMNLVKNNENTEGCRYLGVAELADSSIQYLLEVTCAPINKLQVRRDTLKAILIGLEKNNIEVPFTQIDIHEK